MKSEAQHLLPRVRQPTRNTFATMSRPPRHKEPCVIHACRPEPPTVSQRWALRHKEHDA